MAVEVVENSPLAKAIQGAVQPKLVETGWSTGVDDDVALAEYIVLMLVNGKAQEEVAAELAGDLLALDPQDEKVIEFTRWLFHQAEVLNAQLNGTPLPAPAAQPAPQPAMEQSMATTAEEPENAMPSVEDEEMGDEAEAAQGSIPTGPKAMRNGAPRSREKRVLGQLNKAMDRSSDNALHRVRGTTGTGRINSHNNREPPKGPKSQLARNVQTFQNRMMPQQQQMGMPQMPNGGPVAPFMGMSPQQQLDMFAMYEQQAQMMAQMLQGQNPQMSPGNFNPAFQNGQQGGKSLFDRVQNKGNRQGFNKKPQSRSNGSGQGMEMDNTANGADEPTSSMEVESSQPKDPSETVCRFNLSCGKPDCPFVHQSPAAPPGTTIDMTDSCSFGAACKNFKCVAKHPSPAQKMVHQSQADCKFYPNCTNPLCPFKHPSTPPCRNGADCSVPNCKFAHSKTMCKFNPCLNPACPFKHGEGQKRGNFADKVWTPDGDKKEHVSERKFIDEEKPEELIIPGSENQEPANGDAQPSQESQVMQETQIII